MFKLIVFVCFIAVAVSVPVTEEPKSTLKPKDHKGDRTTLAPIKPVKGVAKSASKEVAKESSKTDKDAPMKKAAKSVAHDIKTSDLPIKHTLKPEKLDLSTEKPDVSEKPEKKEEKLLEYSTELPLERSTMEKDESREPWTSERPITEEPLERSSVWPNSSLKPEEEKMLDEKKEKPMEMKDKKGEKMEEKKD